MINKLPNQQTTMAAKKDPRWYVPTMDYYISKAANNKDIDKTIENLRGANGIINNKTIEYIIKPFGDNTDKYLHSGKLQGELRDVDIITPIKDKQIGEYLELPYKYTVISFNAKTVMEKHAEIRKQMEKLMQQAYINECNKVMETGVPSQDVPDLAKFADDYTNKWLEDRANKGLKRLELHNQENYFDIHRAKSFFYWWACEEFYTYRYIEGDRVVVESIDPTKAYPIENGEEFVEDMEGMLVRTAINFNTFITKYGNKFTGKQVNIVKGLTEKYFAGLPLDVPRQIYFKDFRDWEIEQNGSNALDLSGTITLNNDQIIEDRITFTTQKLVKILTYTDGIQTYEKQVDEDYQFDPTNGDISVEDTYVNTIMTGYRFGGETGLYIEPVEEEVIRRDENNPNRVKLPYGGKTRLFNGLYRNPIPKRLLPYQAILRLFTYAIEKAVGSYKQDFVTIPKSVLESGTEADAVGRMYYLKADGTLIYDDDIVDLQTIAQGIRVLPGSGADKYLNTMLQLIERVKKDAFDIANMNDERFGNTPRSSTATGAKQNMYQAKISSNLMIYLFNKALEKDHNADMEYTKYAWINGKKGYIVNTDTNTVDEVEVDGQEHLETRYSIYITNAIDEANKLEDYRTLAFNAGQNGDAELASEAISATSSSQLRQYITEHMEAARAFEKSKEEAANNAMLEAKKIDAAENDKNRQKDIEITRMKEEGANYRKQLEIDAMITSEDLSRQHQYMTSLEDRDFDSFNEARKVDLKEQDLNQRQQFHDDEMKLKHKQMNKPKQ